MATSSTGEAILAKMIDQFGPDAVEAALGAWLAKSHKDRPRLMWAKPDKPARAPHYLAFVRQLPCCICGAQEPNDPHHFGPRGIGQKTDDYRTIPLCRGCHDRVHSGKDACKDFSPRIVSVLIKYLRIVEQT